MSVLSSIMCAVLSLVNVCFISEKTDIIIFRDSISSVEIDRLYQDFDAEDNDNLYEVQIEAKSSGRFKIRYWPLGKHDSYKEGWVEKRHCGVFLRSNGYTSDGHSYINIYTSSRTIEHIRIYDMWDMPVQVIDYFKSGRRLKVSIPIGNVTVVGWIDRFCPYIYNSCT